MAGNKLIDLQEHPMFGSVTVLQNHLWADIVEKSKRQYTTGEMFFKPYTKEEFFHNARRLAAPLALTMGFVGIEELALVIVILDYLTLYTLSMGLLFDAIDEDCSESVQFIDFANQAISMLCQLIVDLVVYPLALTAMITRSASTLLQDIGILDFDEEHTDSTRSFSKG